MVSIFKKKRFWGILLVLFGLLLIGGELFARYSLGLGDPPLTLADEVMEYRFKPGEYERFGRTIVVNDFSMRSDPVTPAKTGPDEIRVLCLGDSVLNGGSQTDHTELATTIWQEKLTAEFGRPVWVGNASAGSWGPGNLLAYTQKFGWFDADVVVILLSSHDAGDVMRFIPVAGSANFPNRKPWLALQEGITRYLPRYLPRASSPASPTPAEPVQPEGADYERDSPNVSLALGKLDELVQSARAGGTRPVLLIQHPERLIELDGPWLPGHAWMADIAKQSGADTLELREALRSDIAQGRTPYQDNIHLNPRGQQVLVDAVWPWLNRAVAHATQVEKQD